MTASSLLSALAVGVFLATSFGPAAVGQRDILANDRLTVIPPSGDMEVATSNDVVLHVNNDPVLQVIVSWKSLDGNQIPQDAREEKQGILTFGAGGQAVIGVHPPTLGTMVMSVEVDFQDARYALSTTVVNVGLPRRKPKTFELSTVTNPKMSVLHMDLGAHKTARLEGVATYSGYKFPVDVDAAKLKFAAEPAESPIEVDPATGIVIARTYGMAMVRAKLGGHESDMCVVVSKDAESGPANCGGASGSM